MSYRDFPVFFDFCNDEKRKFATCLHKDSYYPL